MAERSELSLFRCAAGLTALEVVRLLKPHFPLIDKTVISKAEHGDLYGVELNRKAWDILKEAYPIAYNKAQKRKADRHKKTRRLSVRLSEDRFLQLQHQMQAEGLTAQEFLERVLGGADVGTVNPSHTGSDEGASCDRECQQQPPCVPPLKGGGSVGGASEGGSASGRMYPAPTGAVGGADG